MLEAWYRPARVAENASLGVTLEEARRPELLGSWNGWQRPGPGGWRRYVAADGTEWRYIRVPLAPGSYQYGIALGRRIVLDEANPQSTFITDPRTPGSPTYGLEVSRIEIEDCTQPVLAIDGTRTEAGRLELSAHLEPGTGGAGLDPASLRWTVRRGPDELAPGTLRAAMGGNDLVLSAEGLPAGKYTIEFEAADLAGQRTPRTAASAFVEHDGRPGARPLSDGLVYQVVIDRFRGTDGALVPPPSPGDRAGGTLAGLQAAIEAGYFERMGVTTLWLSPLYENPEGRRLGRDGRIYEAYHGYWPSEPRAVETRFGGEAALDALVASAHAHGLRLVADAVPNHVYESHPYFRERSRIAPSVSTAPDPDAASWFNDGPSACLCGINGCPWDLACWFDRYLPDLNWRNPAVQEAQTSDLVWWMKRFDLDGLRIDAVPLMPRAATRAMVLGVRQSVRREGLDSLLLGETYTGPGDAGRAEIRYYLGRAYDGLDSQFDFPLMWATRGAFAWDTLGLVELEREWALGQSAWDRSGATIAYIIGNHDTTRFVSEAAGDAGGDPWLTPPVQPTDEEPYRRHLLGMAFILTLPGMPVIYQGDEIALAGGGDPDSRRVMPDVLGTLPPLEAAVLERVSRLGRLRRCMPALRRGLRRTLLVDRDHSVALLEPPPGEETGGPALVVLSRRAGDLSVPGVPVGRWRDALAATTLSSQPTLTRITVGRLDAAVYLQENSPCLE